MKLSDAIRLGAMLRPQVAGETRNAFGTCALGAALDAMGRVGFYTETFDIWPLTSVEVWHPVTGDRVIVLSAIRELNDGHRWTRERIADWVATIEAQQPEPAVQPQPVAVEA